MKITLEPEKIIIDGEHRTFSYSSGHKSHGCEITNQDDSKLNAQFTNIIFVPTHVNSFGSNWTINGLEYRYICLHEGKHAFMQMNQNFETEIYLMEDKELKEIKNETTWTYKNYKLTVLSTNKDKK